MRHGSDHPPLQPLVSSVSSVRGAKAHSSPSSTSSPHALSRQSSSAPATTPATPTSDAREPLNKKTNKTTTPTTTSTTPATGLSLHNASKLKLMAASQRRKIQSRRRDKTTATRLATAIESEETGATTSSATTSTSDTYPNPSPVPAEPQRRPLGTFETKDNKWKAVILGDLEKFMYPSLRLESLYEVPTTDTAGASSSGAASVPMPTPAQVDAEMAATTKVTWHVEKRFQNATQSAPANGHPRVADESERRRLHFDTQLETAEGLLRKKELQLFESKRQQGFLESIGSSKREQATPGLDNSLSAEAMLARGRERGASLYQPHVVNTPQVIPRLPHTRKIIKEIQRHTSSDGQIQYYADKQNLFTKWKKLQVSELHKLTPPVRSLYYKRHDDDPTCNHNHNHDDDENGRDARAADELFDQLSPRSLFFHECAQKRILPEPIFSRIHEVAPAPSRARQQAQALLLPSVATPRTGETNRATFCAVASKLVRAVHASQTANHEDVEPTHVDGKYRVKKHHVALHLQHFGLGDAKLDALATSLQHFQSIHVLDLSDNRLTDTAILHLLESLETASSFSLTSRPLSGNGASTSTSTSTSTTPSTNPTTAATPASRRRANDLRVLNLSQNTIGVAGCTQIARFLGICTQLTHLDLSRAQIGGDDAVRPLTSAIETHRSLQVVNLASNTIRATCATLVGDMLTQPSCGVAELDISWNQICRSGAIAIGRSLRTNTMLCKLNLAMNRFSDEGAEQLAAALAGNTSLVELDLSRNNLGGRSAVAFAFFLRRNHSLRQLRLDDNRIGATGAKALLRTVSRGSPCEFHVSAHDVESRTGEKDPIFDVLVPSMLSPFALRVGESPYEFAVCCELLDAALVHKTCSLRDVVYVDYAHDPKKPTMVHLGVDSARGTLVETATGKIWRPPRDFFAVSNTTRGVFQASALFAPPPVCVTPHFTELSCAALVRIIERSFSSREKAQLLALALDDLYLATAQASLFVSKLRGSIDVVEIVGRLWPCLVDGHNVYAFLQQHLTAAEQRRLIDNFGVSMIQFTTHNPTGRWSLNLGDRGQRKLAIWFAMLNAHESSLAQELHAKRTDSSQFGKSYRWRNVALDRTAIPLTYAFFDHLPCSGVLEFDFVSTLRHEDFRTLAANGGGGDAVHELSDETLDAMLTQIGLEVFAIYIPLHKRTDLKYQLLLFHVAIAHKFITSAQAHRIVQYFPKNFEQCRFKILVAVHRMLVDLENVGELLDRLTLVDRRRVYTALGYLNVVNPLCVDNLDFEVDFERDDEKALLRALVDLSMSCPMDMIRIESERSTVLVIYSMYQTNSVPAQGTMFFRYMSHPLPTRSEFLKLRSAIFRHFLCGERLRVYVETALAATAGGGGGGGGGGGAPLARLGSAQPRSGSTSAGASASGNANESGSTMESSSVTLPSSRPTSSTAAPLGES